MWPKISSGQHFAPNFDELMASMMDEYKIPGASVAVIECEQIFVKGYGVTEPGGNVVIEDTVFDCASMSKSFTAAAVALLVDDDEKYPDFNWDTPVSHILRDDFVLYDAYATENVNIVDVLTHTTGVPGNDLASMGHRAQRPDTPRSLVRKIRYFPPNKPIRSERQYSNEMYTAASCLVETLASQPFPEFLKAQFWTPLEMRQTGFGMDHLEGIEASKIAKPMYWNEKSNSYDRLPFINGPEGQGAGEIKSTASDWAKWIRAMMNRTLAVSAESLDQLVTPRIIASEEPEADDPHESPRFEGMGWQIEYYRGQKMIGHGGSIPGFSSFMCWLPKSKFGFVMFGNSDGMGDAADVIAQRLIDDHLGVREAERADWAGHLRETVKKEKEENEQSVDEIYPGRPSQPLPPALSLEDYVGRYEHPAYEVLDLVLNEGMLFADASDRTFPFELRLAHVSGEYFVAHIQFVPDMGESHAVKAQFDLGVDGRVAKLGVDFVDKEGSELVWFTKASLPAEKI